MIKNTKQAQNPFSYSFSSNNFNLFKKQSGLNTHYTFKKIQNKLALQINFRIFIKNSVNHNIKNLYEINKKSLNFLKKVKNYKEMCHRRKRPVRGQRTHTNAKTQKKYKRI